MITIFSGCHVIDPIVQVSYLFNIVGYDRIGESVKADRKFI